MNTLEIERSLFEAFNEPVVVEELRKIIFWQDFNKSFVDVIDELVIDQVKIHKLHSNNFFYTKYLLEEVDAESNYLIYISDEVKLNQENWLIDCMLYSKIFVADSIALLIKEIGLDSTYRSIVEKNEKFFKGKDRIAKFKLYGLTNPSHQDVEVAIMCVVCGMKTTNFEELLRTVLMNSIEDSENKYLDKISRFAGIDLFWKYVSNHYGYTLEDKSLKKLLTHLMLTNFSQTLSDQHLSGFSDYVGKINRNDCILFIDRWMKHVSDSERYYELALSIEQELGLNFMVGNLTIQELTEADGFPSIDKSLLLYVINCLDDKHESYDELLKIIDSRKTKHFYRNFKTIYDALSYTIHMYAFRKKYMYGIPQNSLIEMYKSYENEYAMMDYYYRKFYTAYDEDSDSEILKKLKNMVEGIYSNWFMLELSSNWSKSLSGESKESWAFPGVKSIETFYADRIRGKIYADERVFVIISDALRYEIAIELNDKLNTETLGSSSIESFVSTMPSITKFGMAALLPHKKIEVSKNGNVYVDGKDTSGLENRRAIIQSNVFDSEVVEYKDVVAMNKPGRREFFKGKKLVYIYHNSIDATGDNAATEMNVFGAAEKAIDEISNIVRIIRDDLSGTNIIITADHGFIYQRDSVEESDKLGKEKIEVMESKRRYMISPEKHEIDGVHRFNLDTYFDENIEFYAYVPKANMRFKTQGSGANYVHGGASLQEIVVPVITYKNIRRGQANSKEIEKVEIKLTNSIHKVTNKIFKLNFFQSEKVEGKRVPTTVRAYLVDSENQLISNEVTIIGDKTSENPHERNFEGRFTLKSMNYDKNAKYYLIIKDVALGIEKDRIPFSISLGIVSDFDF